MMKSRTALIGTIGETHIALALGDIDELSVAHFALLSSADFESPMVAIARYLPTLPVRPERVALACSGTVAGELAELSTRHWRFSAQDIAQAAGANDVLLLPELEALARAVPHLAAADIVPVQAAAGDRDAPALVILSGNSFEAAVLFRLADGAPVLLAHPARLDGPAGALGEGLTAAGLMRRREDSGGNSHSAASIVRLGLTGDDMRAAALVDETITALGHAAAELAILVGARGGVFLTGALAATLVPARIELFRTAFLRKADTVPGLGLMPVSVIKLSADAAMRGAALCLAARDG